MEAKLKTKRCCVPNCKDVTSRRHRFPKDDLDLFQKWVNNVNNPKLAKLEVHQIYKTYYVCNKHFTKEFIVPGTKRGLRRDAFPALFLSSNELDTSTLISTESEIVHSNVQLIKKEPFERKTDNAVEFSEPQESEVQLLQKRKLDNQQSSGSKRRKKRKSSLHLVIVTKAQHISSKAKYRTITVEN